MTTGSHHMQLYWMRDRNGRLRQLSWLWLIRDERWISGEAAVLQSPESIGGIAAHWQKNCIKCHSVGGQPRMVLASRAKEPNEPRVGELGIACEACHGPAEQHVRVNRNPMRRYFYHLTGKDDPSIVPPEQTLPAALRLGLRPVSCRLQLSGLGLRYRNAISSRRFPGGLRPTETLRQSTSPRSKQVLLERRNLARDRSRVHSDDPARLLHSRRDVVQRLPFHARQRSRRPADSQSRQRRSVP